MPKRKVQQPEKKGAPAWMTTYGDMVTLLLTFFVMLYSFSSIDSGKWQGLIASFSGETGVFENGALTQAQSDYEALQRQQLEFQKLYEQLNEYIKQNELSNQVWLYKTNSEIQIRFVDNVFFDSGKATLKPEAVEILTQITQAFQTYNDSIEMVRIEGHTDNVAISTSEFPTNWELSTARAVEVLRFMIEKRNIDPKKASAVGYGEYHPIGDNSTAAGRAQNRRVDFVIARTTDKRQS